MTFQVRPTVPGSTTQTVQANPTLVLPLRYVPTIEERKSTLHQEIQNSNLLPPEMVPEPVDFCASTPKQHGMFLLNILEPAMVCYENDGDAVNTLLTFHSKLKQIIQEMLPPGVTIDELLRKCERRTDKAIKRALTHAHRQEKTQQIYDRANEANQLNITQNQALNERMRQINEHRSASVASLNTRLSQLQTEMQAIYSNALTSAPGIQSLCQRMQVQEASIQQLLQQAESSANRV